MSEADHWATPSDVFGPLHERFRFTIDVAAAAHNAKCERFYGERDNGLMQSWAGERAWCNPPYSHPNLGRWIDKAWQQSGSAELIVMLVPADRTGQPWWQKRVEPFRDRPGSGLRVEFLPGRVMFSVPNSVRGDSRRPKFSSCLLIWDHP
jgi:phage N-6-adenine-methyltransferase